MENPRKINGKSQDNQQQILGKSMEHSGNTNEKCKENQQILLPKGGLGRGWSGLDGPWPGGTRGPAYTALAVAFGFCKSDFVTGFNTALARKGLAVFN